MGKQLGLAWDAILSVALRGAVLCIGRKENLRKSYDGDVMKRETWNGPCC